MMLDSCPINLEDFAVSPQNAFLPTTPPVTLLSDKYYGPWEATAASLPLLIKSGAIRTLVDAIPVLTTDKLLSEEEWRRAYSILGFITHAYIWGGQQPKDTIPPCITKPFLEISNHLGLPPCATYAALVLWNYTVRPGGDITDPSDVNTFTSFTGGQDEEWFYVVSVAIEAKSGKLLTLMLDAIAAATANDIRLLTALLYSFTDGLEDFNKTLKRMYEKCRPEVFFNELRPLLAGSKNMAKAGLPNGVYYDEGDGVGEWHQYSGGSNAQSSIIQAFDIFLGVAHGATGGISGPAGFLIEAREYMPGPHRAFLETLSEVCNVRSFVASCQDPSLKEAFNAACMMLGSFRDTHIQIVSRYIIMPARRKPSAEAAGTVNLATTSVVGEKDGDDDEEKALHGTGGTSLIPFLKQTRDTTKAATL